MFLTLLLGAALFAASTADFNSTWHDGRAELDGYRLIQPRYGEARSGTAVMIWVVEPFSVKKHVKLDRPEQAGADAVQVMKLNLVRKFPTGIYDYTLLTSVFSPLVFSAGGPSSHRALKVTFSGQEWCGNTFSQLDVRGDELVSHWHSYFESEGDGEERISLTTDTLLEDELWYRLRGLTAPLAPGRYRLVPSLASARLSHTPLHPGMVEIARKGEERQRVPAGEFSTQRFELILRPPGRGRPEQRRTVWVETAAPHRIIAWEGDLPSFQGNEPSRERGALTGSIRDAYWQHNRVADEGLLKKLNLPAR